MKYEHAINKPYYKFQLHRFMLCLRKEIEVLEIFKGHDGKWITYSVQVKYLLSEISWLLAVDFILSKSKSVFRNRIFWNCK